MGKILNACIEADFWTIRQTFKGKNEAELLLKANKYADKHNLELIK